MATGEFRSSGYLEPGKAVATTSHDGLKFWQFMVAGSVAGSVEHMAMFPVHTLKTRMQAIRTCPAKSAGVRRALRSVLRTEGLAGLYRGISAMGLGAGPAHAVYFSVYEFSKKAILSAAARNELGNHGGGGVGLTAAAAHAASGVVATAASDAVMMPMDVVKQRLQLEGSPYRGVRDCARRVLVGEGIGAFYASYWTTVVMNAPFTAVHFATYEAVKKGMVVDTEEESLVVHATAGAAAVLTTPLDVVKTQLQCQGVCGCQRFASSSIQDVISAIVKKDGYMGLMRGWIMDSSSTPLLLPFAGPLTNHQNPFSMTRHSAGNSNLLEYK